MTGVEIGKHYKCGGTIVSILSRAESYSYGPVWLVEKAWYASPEKGHVKITAFEDIDCRDTVWTECSLEEFKSHALKAHNAGAVMAEIMRGHK